MRSFVVEEDGPSQDALTELLSDVPSDDKKLLDVTNPLIRDVSGTNSDSESNSNEDNSDGNCVGTSLCSESQSSTSSFIQHVHDQNVKLMDLLAESRKSDKPNYLFTECEMTYPIQKEFISKSTISSPEDISPEEPSSTEYAFTSASVEMAPIATITPSITQKVPEVDSTVPTETSVPSTPSDQNDSLIAEAGTDLSDNETKELLSMLDLAMEVSRTESTNLDSNSDNSLPEEVLTPVKPPALQVKTLPFSPLQKPAVETTLLDETAIVSADQSSYLKSVFTSVYDSLVADEEETSEEKNERVVSVQDVVACGQGVMSESDEIVVISEEDMDSIDRYGMRDVKKEEEPGEHEVDKESVSEELAGEESVRESVSEESPASKSASEESVSESVSGSVGEEPSASEVSAHEESAHESTSEEQSTNEESSIEQLNDMIDPDQIASGPVSPNELSESSEHQSSHSSEIIQPLSDPSESEGSKSDQSQESEEMEEGLSSVHVLEVSSDSETSHSTIQSIASSNESDSNPNSQASVHPTTLHHLSSLSTEESINERISPQRVDSAVTALVSPTTVRRPWTEVIEESRETEIMKRLREGMHKDRMII